MDRALGVPNANEIYKAAFPSTFGQIHIPARKQAALGARNGGIRLCCRANLIWPRGGRKTRDPPPRLKAVAAALWGRPLKVELAKFCKTRSDI